LFILKPQLTALTALGIPNANQDMHENHYHIDFNTPARLGLEPSQNLMADGPSVPNVSDAAPKAPHESSFLLALDLAREWRLSENDMDMYFPADLESAQAPIVIVAATRQSGQNVIGVCQPVDNASGFDLRVAAQTHFFLRGVEPMEVDISRIEIKVIGDIQQTS
jgi:hypothetical protein